MVLRAVMIYARPSTLPRAYDWCAARGWIIEAVVPRERWQDALRLLAEGRAQIIVAASPDALDPDRLPRVEVIEDGDDGTG